MKIVKLAATLALASGTFASVSADAAQPNLTVNGSICIGSTPTDRNNSSYSQYGIQNDSGVAVGMACPIPFPVTNQGDDGVIVTWYDRNCTAGNAGAVIFTYVVQDTLGHTVAFTTVNSSSSFGATFCQSAGVTTGISALPILQVGKQATLLASLPPPFGGNLSHITTINKLFTSTTVGQNW